MTKLKIVKIKIEPQLDVILSWGVGAIISSLREKQIYKAVFLEYSFKRLSKHYKEAQIYSWINFNRE